MLIVPGLVHADDPVFLASSAGELQRTIDIVSAWCVEHGAEFHVNQVKTVAFRMGGSGEAPRFTFPSLVGGVSVPSDIASGAVKKWLGWMWDVSCGAQPPGASSGISLPSTQNYIASHAGFSAISKGHITPIVASDGSIRQFPALICVDGMPYPALAISALLEA